MATRLAAAVVIVAIVSLLAAMIVGLRTGASLAQDIYQDRIISLRGSANLDTTSQVAFYERAAEGLAQSPQASAAIERFGAGIEELDVEGGPSEAETDELYDAYRTEYLDPQRDAGNPIDFRDIISQRPAALTLQYEYAVDLGYADEPQDIDDAGDGSYWSETHALVHPMYRDMAERLDLVDVMLVDADRNVVYSARKGPELGTSLEAGPFSGGVLADVAARVIADPDAGTQVSDLSFTASSLVPVGVVAAPVVDEGGAVGALVLMYDSAPFTTILTADGEWADAGYPDSSDTYLVGDDQTVRSEPRGFVEDPTAFLDRLEELGEITPEQRTAIDGRGTTVLTLRAPDEVLRAIEDGDDSIVDHSGFTGVDSLGSAAPVASDAITWSSVATMTSDVAQADLQDFRQLFAVGIAIFVAALAFVAVWWGNRFVSPVREISERLAARRAAHASVDPGLADETPGLALPERSPIEFHQLANSFETMALTLRAQRAEVETARDDRLRLLREMLPPTIAQRVSEGQIRMLEEIPSVTVGVGTVEGLGALVHVETSDDGRALVERINAELDQLAGEHGVERVKIVGDAYYAACGHDRPYIDHAPRMTAFATEARDAIRRIAGLTGDDLDLSFGIHSGPVTVGMAGGRRLVYDVWGPTVTIAHNLARVAGVGQILISTATRRLLPDTIEVAEFAATTGADAGAADGVAGDGTDADRSMALAPSGAWILEAETIPGARS
jgi:class 3 adenylate cyclase